MNSVKIYLVILASAGISLSVSAQTLTLEAALQVAQEKSPALQKSTLELKQSYFGLKSAKLASWSTVDLRLVTPQIKKEYTIVYTDSGSKYITVDNILYSTEFKITQPIIWTDSKLSLINTIDATRDLGYIKNYKGNLSIQLEQPLFTYNKQSVGLEKAEIQLTIAEKNYLANQQDIIFQVKSAYFDWFKAIQFVRIAESELEQVKSSYDLAKKKFDSGIIAEVEVLKLEVDYATSQNDVYQKKTSALSAENRLKILLGMPLEENISAPSEINLKQIKIGTESILPEALKNRPEIDNAQKYLRLQEISVIETDAQREFNMSLVLGVGLTKADADLARITNNPNRSQDVSLTLTVPIWDWGRNSAQVQSQRAVYDSRQIDVSEAKKNLVNEINNLTESYLAAESRLKILEKTVSLAQKSYDISYQKFRSGNLSSEELAQTQKRLTDSKVNSITALLDYHLSIAALNKACLFDWENNLPLTENLPQFED